MTSKRPPIALGGLGCFAYPFRRGTLRQTQPTAPQPPRSAMNLTDYIRDIPDFPKPGILFKDIMPLLANPNAFAYAVAKLGAHYATRPVDAVASAEARGFLFAAPMALELHRPLAPPRKPGKRPYQT